jgi:hypothetical protein
MIIRALLRANRVKMKDGEIIQKIAIRKKKAEDAYNSTTSKKRTYHTYG